MLPIQASFKRSVLYSASKLKSSQQHKKRIMNASLKLSEAAKRKKLTCIERAETCIRELIDFLDKFAFVKEVPAAENSDTVDMCLSYLTGSLQALSDAKNTSSKGYQYALATMDLNRLVHKCPIPETYELYKSYKETLDELLIILEDYLPTIDPPVNN